MIDDTSSKNGQDTWPRCPECGGLISYPPLCEDPKCGSSWVAWGNTFTRKPPPIRKRFAHRKRWDRNQRK
jgi:hypothetical protein